MQFNRLVFYIALLAVFVMAFQPSVDTDSWWHLRSGAWMIENGQILKSDPFSLTRQGDTWVYPGWLSQIILILIFDRLGFLGLNLFTALMVLITFTILWAALEGRVILRAFILLLAAVTSGLYWSARPQILTLLLTSASLYLLEGLKKGRQKQIWLYPLIMLLWVNIHGGFIIGYILVGIYILGDVIEALLASLTGQRSLMDEWQERKKIISNLLFVGIVCIFVSMINPHGPSILLYPLKTVSMGTLQDYIAEWQSPNFHTSEVQPFILMLFLTFFALSISTKKPLAKEFLLVGVFGYMSLLAVRNIGLFALVAAPIASRHLQAGLQPLLERVRSKKEVPESLAKWINILLAVLLTFMALIRILTQLGEEVNNEHINNQIPLEAFEYIEEHRPDGALFNSYNWGGYVLWKLYPDYLSFVDGRTDLFSDEILSQYLQAWLAEPGWEEFLEGWGIEWALLENNSPLSRAMVFRGWEIKYQDEQAMILQRNPPQP